MFLRNRRYDQRGMQADQSRPQRTELRVSPAYFQFLSNISVVYVSLIWLSANPSPDCVGNVASTTLHVLSSIGDDDL